MRNQTKMVTAETDAEREARFRAALERTCGVRKAIVAHAKGKRGVAGCIPCPVDGCGGTVRYSIAACNGHVWAGCSNAAKGCVSWVE